MRYAHFWRRQAWSKEPASRERGFILLLVLWFLLLAGVIGSAVLLSGPRAARHAQAGVTLPKADLALVAVLNEIVFVLLVHGPHSPWAEVGALERFSICLG